MSKQNVQEKPWKSPNTVKGLVMRKRMNMPFTEENARLDSVFSKLLYPNPCPRTPLTQCAEKKKKGLFPLPAMIKGVMLTQCSLALPAHAPCLSINKFFFLNATVLLKR